MVSEAVSGADEWPALRAKVVAGDILIVATPTWLGQPSSIAKRVLERMDAMLSETKDDGRPIAYDKVAGVVVTGNEDGAHHCISEISGALIDIGYTIAGQGWTYWNKGPGPGEEEYLSSDETAAPAPDDPLVGGHLSAAICNAVVRIQREYLGRGPTKARASLHGDIIVVLMQDTLTKAERSLAADGRQDDVLRSRRSLQGTMRNDITAAVEELTGRSVIAFMSDTHIHPDLACEVLVLEPDEADRGEEAAEDPGP